ncbi:hypothetical protein Thimo_2065 [Thioflavicoccus mobilis 8321]|uniref:Cysteine-rich CWC n=1 Tax=Thioflavicoccus mobilis 8321 TaxID=765912 RepID=L0GVM5_9GAMM|nr:cysteine-rich CWC family protein [Thioflavicoccus mobilis]AGA90818.1 hypothetical protein Thimo_2065 [Thioflavicoccus mobilis 8321]
MNDNQQATDITAGQKRCGRCGATFLCKVDELPHCQCIRVHLSDTLLEELSGSYSDCLCSRCLKQLAGKDRDGDWVLSGDAGT